MVAIGGRAGVPVLAAGAGWARPAVHAVGNDVPPITGDPGPDPRPGPAPAGQAAAGQVGGIGDGLFGSDPQVPKDQPTHVSYLSPMQESGLAWGLQGFNDRLTVKDRHVYWDTGTQRTGTTPSVPGNPPNPVTDGPTQPALRALNRTLSWQVGSDHTANQDDLSRPYTWLGEQGSGHSPVYGGVPGLFQPYGTRGGVPYPIVDPTDGQGGRDQVWAGPPHGLHSLTLPDNLDTLRRYQSTPQQAPPRIDRPANSPQAGQSYSQTVQYQGGGPVAGARPNAQPGVVLPSGRGWAGTGKV